MKPAATDTPPDFSHVKPLLLDIARERETDHVLRLIVERLAAVSNIRCARVWLAGPGDQCDSCPLSSRCTNRARCLHLAASASSTELGAEDDIIRCPLGIGEAGRIAVGGELVIRDLAIEPPTVSLPAWVQRVGVRGFAGQPLEHGGEVLGVLEVFTAVPVTNEGPSWLRVIADHAAAALANARAFEEIRALRHQLQLENEYLRAEVEEAQSFGDIIGQSPALRRAIEQIDMVAPTDATVLVLGESGTGKELIAREIHRRSKRADHPMIRVNCASIPAELYESEFFGHVQGAFTGALRDRTGRFELADGGTLFLDEVGEIPLALQAKLLRVLQEAQFERVGDDVTRQADVRIIAATNRNLKVESDAGRFRQDLYFRLNVFPVEIAPLRERREDIRILAEHFAAQSGRKLGCPTKPRFSEGHTVLLERYSWPGNVRELQNVIERAVIRSRDCSGSLDLTELSRDLPPADQASGLPAWLPSNNSAANPAPAAEPARAASIVPDQEIREFERTNLIEALRRCAGKVYGAGGAAEMLGLKPTTLASRIRRLGIDWREDGRR